jgi:hypothetical protein
MRGHPAVSNWRARPRLHPDFGYHWLSCETRRKVNAAICYLALGTVIGATIAITIAHRAADDGVRNERLMTAAVEPPSSSPTEGGFRLASVPPACGSCDDPAAAPDSPRASEKLRARHTAQPSTGLATVVIGHVNASADSADPRESTGPIANAVTPTAGESPEQASPYDKKTTPDEKRERHRAGGFAKHQNDQNRFWGWGFPSYAANQAPRTPPEPRSHWQQWGAQNASAGSRGTQADFQNAPDRRRAYFSFGSAPSSPAGGKRQ